MEETRNVYRSLVQKYFGRRQTGRPSHWWRENVNHYLSDIMGTLISFLIVWFTYCDFSNFSLELCICVRVNVTEGAVSAMR